MLAGPGFGNALLKELRLDLLLMVGGMITEQDTKFKEAIPASLPLAVILLSLASEDSFTSLMYTLTI